MNDSLQSREIAIAGILVGGRSRRMDTDKATLPHPAGGTFVEHAVAVATAVSQRVVLLGDSASLPATINKISSLKDAIPNAGPIGGLASLLHEIDDNWALLLACDMPRLSPTTLAPLLAHSRELNQTYKNPNVITYAGENSAVPLHTCCTLYHRSTLATVEEQLHTQRYRMQDLLTACRTLVVKPTPKQRTQLNNVNTKEDYERLFA